MLSGARLVRLLGPDCTVLAAHGGFCFGAALVGTKEGINLLRLKYTLGCPYPGQPRHCFIIDFIQHNAGAGGGCSVLLTGAGGGCSVSYLLGRAILQRIGSQSQLAAHIYYLLPETRAQASIPPRGLVTASKSLHSAAAHSALPSRSHPPFPAPPPPPLLLSVQEGFM